MWVFSLDVTAKLNLSVVVWVPDAELLDVEYSGSHRADEIITSLEMFEPEKWGLPAYSESQ